MIESAFNGSKIKKTVVVSSTQYPGYGGAATNAYAIIKFLRKEGYNTVGVFFHSKLDVNYDPDEIGGIFLYDYKFEEGNVFDNAVKYLGVKPDICLAKNYMAPIYCKRVFNCYTVYLVSGINHLPMFYKDKTSNELLEMAGMKFDEKADVLSKFGEGYYSQRRIRAFIINSFYYNRTDPIDLSILDPQTAAQTLITKFFAPTLHSLNESKAGK